MLKFATLKPLGAKSMGANEPKSFVAPEDTIIYHHMKFGFIWLRTSGSFGVHKNLEIIKKRNTPITIRLQP